MKPMLLDQIWMVSIKLCYKHYIYIFFFCIECLLKNILINITDKARRILQTILYLFYMDRTSWSCDYMNIIIIIIKFYSYIVCYLLRLKKFSNANKNFRMSRIIT